MTAILWTASLLVPAELRAEWLREWGAELWYVEFHRLHFCLGAYSDALWLRRNTPSRPFLESPVACLAMLAFLTAALGAISLNWPVSNPDPTILQPLRSFLLIIGITCLILPTTTRFSLGEYPAGGRLRLRAFLAAKVALALLLFYFAALTLPHFKRSGGTFVIFILWSCIFTFRWILSDQRRRCPSCLRLLSHPVHVGQASRIFLGWDGTEFLCRKGHGLLHVPETPTSWYDTQRWLSLVSDR